MRFTYEIYPLVDTRFCLCVDDEQAIEYKYIYASH